MMTKKLLVSFCMALAFMAMKGEEVDCPVVEKIRGHENIEWSISYAYHLTDSERNLPRVLLVGDSICKGYQEHVRGLLRGKCAVSYWVSSYCVTSLEYMKLLSFQLDSAKYDVVHFNNGLHSLQTDTAAWARALEAALELVRAKQPHARIIWASSTPLKDAAKTAKARELNAAARSVVERIGGIETDDLFALLDPMDRETNWSDVYHHATAVRELEARQVVRSVLPRLEPMAAKIQVVPDRLTCVYSAGERAVLKVSAVDTNGVALTAGRLRVTCDNFGDRETMPPRDVDLAAENPFTVELTKDTPGFLRLKVVAADTNDLAVVGQRGQDAHTYVYGVAFSPEKIVSGTPFPADFESFWRTAIRRLDETVPIDARMELMPEKSTADVNYYRVSFATCQERRVYGWLSEPKDLSKGPYPVRVSVPGAGIGARGADGDGSSVVLVMNVHSYPQPEGTGSHNDGERRRLYEAQDMRFAVPNGVQRYCQAGIHRSREDYFYYASLLGINRAVDWLAKRPACDLRDFTYSGASQGGGFGLMLTALNAHFTRSCIFVPAITDLLGHKVESRQSGWPQLIEAQKDENKAAAERNVPYFCGVNFARLIHCPIRFVVGFSDTVCSPNAVYSAYNACPSVDKAIFNGIGMGHRVFGDFSTYLGAWQKASVRAKGDYRFLAFNVWGDFFGNPPHERDLREGELVRRWNPDFAAFQEVTRKFWKSRLFDPLRDEYEIIGQGMGPKGADASNPLVFRKSRFELVDKGAEWFCEELDKSKGVVWAVVRDRANGKAFVIFASHYWWQGKGVGDGWIRLLNSKILYATLSRVAAKYDAAVVGGGDLNAPSDSDAMRYLVAQGWSDAQDTALVSPKGFQTDHYDPQRDATGAYCGIPAVRGMASKVLSLDHIFYDPKRISVGRFDLDITPEACALSDHHPVCADFSLQ